jgi:hypothetical protein
MIGRSHQPVDPVLRGECDASGEASDAINAPTASSILRDKYIITAHRKDIKNMR